MSFFRSSLGLRLDQNVIQKFGKMNKVMPFQG